MLRRVTAMLIVFCFLFTTVVQAAEITEKALVPSYSDIADHWAEKDIEKWTGLGLASGYPDGKFKPENYLTRAEFCSVINKVFGYIEKSSQQFDDINSSKWYANSALKAKAAGYIKDWVKEFKLNEPITREEVCAAVFKAFKLSKANTSECLKKYSDLSDNKVKYSDEIASAIANGFLTGYKDNTFRPFDKITRAEFTKVLNSSIGELFSKAGSYSSKQIKGNVIVNTSDVTLKDTKIGGSLYLTEGIGEGTVTLENVTVEGQTYINGGGKNSIYIKNSSLGNVNIKKADGKIRIVMSQSTIASITAGSGVILQTEGTANRLQGLIIDSSTMAGQIIDINEILIQ